MKNFLFLFCLINLFSLQLFSGSVTQQKAKTIGQNFLTTVVNEPVDNAEMKLIFTAVSEQTQTPLFYVFNFNIGFIIVSADDVVTPILAYSTNRQFIANDIPAHIQSFLQGYKNEIEGVNQLQLAASYDIRAQWQALESNQSDRSTFTRNERAINPLLTTNWDQNSYYNNACPVDPSGPGEHTYAGCVATTMAQIINYWEYPNQGKGSHRYTDDYYGNQTVNYSNSTYNYSLMPDVITSTSSTQQINAVSTLMYQCGVAVNMDYGTSVSNAFSLAARVAFVNHFNYSESIGFADKNQYSTEEWTTLIKSNLNAGMPVFYSGQGNAGGHAFVCDGYDASDYFHINWGWSGSYNGYFLLSALNPGSYHFNNSQAAILNIIPKLNYSIPIAPSNFTVTAGANQQLSATLQWTNPSTTQDGSALTSLTSIVIKRNGTTVNTLSNPTIGALQSWVDNTITTSGTYTYEIYATNSFGVGISSVGSAFVGSSCDITVVMSDTYGDGWNGSYIDFQINGVSQGTATISSGSSGTTILTLPSNATINCVWFSGSSWDNECSFVIYNSSNTAIYTSNGTPSVGTFYTFVNNSCSRNFVENISTISQNREVINRNSDYENYLFHNIDGITTQTISNTTLITTPLGINSYNTTNYSNGFYHQFILYPENADDQLLLEVISYVQQTLLVYDGVGTSGTLLKTLDYGSDMNPVVSTSNALTLVYSGNWYRNGFEVSVTPKNCVPIVYNFICDEKTSNSATFSWEVLNASQWTNHNFNYQLEYGLQGFTIGTGETISVTDTFGIIPGLDHATYYDVYLTYNCSNGTPTTIGAVSFKTTLLTECNSPIGTGTDYSIYIPLNATWNEPSYTQQIYTAAELNAVELTVNDLISSISFEYLANENNPALTINNIKVYLGNTTKSSFSSDNDTIIKANLQQVYYGPIKFKKATSSYWIDVNFDETFHYTGGNIVVVFEKPNIGGNYYYNFSCNYNNDYKTIIASGYNSYREHQRNNMKFCIEPICAQPYNIIVDEINNSTIALNWNSLNDATSWNIEYGLSGFNHGEGTLVHSENTSLIISDLNTGIYDFYIQANCGEATSRWASLKNVQFNLSCSEIGNGTQTNTIFPIGYYYSSLNCYTQQLFTFEELSNMGMIENDIITNIGFQYIGISQTKNPITIYIANTSQNNLASWIPESEFQQVFTGSVYLQEGWVNVTFNTLFTWDGTSNIAIAMLNNSGENNNPSNFYVHSTPTIMAREHCQSSNIIPATCISNGNGATHSIRNNMNFCFQTPLCPAPKNFTISGNSSTTVTLSWNRGANETAWNIEYGTTGFEQGTGTLITINDTTVSLTLPNENIDFYLQAVCEAENSFWASLLNIPIGIKCDNFTNLGTTTNNDLPVYYRLNRYSYTQQIILADELAQMGIQSGDLIRNIAFQYNDIPTNPLDITMSIGNTTQSEFTSNHSLSWIPETALQQVYSGLLSIETPNDWSYIEFDQFFEWDGSSNIVIAVWNTRGSASSSARSYVHSVNSNLSKSYSSLSNFSLNSIESSGNVLQVRNNISFCFSTPSCKNPTQFTYNNLTSNTATLQWTATEGNVSWDIIVSTTPITDFSNITPTATVTTSYYNISNLSEVTTYYCYIRSTCADAEGVYWKSLSFTTPCNATVVDLEHPFYEGFEGTYPANCWTITYENPTNTGMDHNSSAAYEGNYGFRFNNESWDNSAPYNQSIVTPMISSDEILKVSFRYKGYNNNSFFKVGYSSNNNDVTSNSFTWTDTLLATNNWELFEQYVPQETKYIAVYAIFESSSPRLYVDAFQIEIFPCNCNAPLNVSVSPITATTATLNWESSICAENSFQVVVSPTEITNFSTVTPINVMNATHYTFENLSPNTTYYTYVRSNCNTTQQSEWISSSFETPCLAITITEENPYVEDFESYTASDPYNNYDSDVPPCWTMIFNGYQSYSPHVCTGAPNGQGLSMVVGPSSWYGTVCFAILPIISTPLKNLNIAFSSLGVASNYTAGNKLYLGYITDVQDESTFEIIAEVPFNIENVTYFNMALNNITFPANARLGFKFLYTTGSYQKGVMIDDINITKLPVCDNPTNLTAESIDNTIELNWIIANNATNYIIYRDNVEIATTTETTYSDNSLLFETEYCYYITALCPYGTSESTDIVCATTAPCNPVRNLTSTVDNISVSLNWDKPLGADEWIFWGNGEYYNAIGINAEFDFDVAQRFEPSDLTDYNGKSLTKVGFMPNVSGNLCTYSVRIWVGGSIEAPGQLIVDQVVNSIEITVSQWNIITLQTPITINASQELWIGYRCNTTTGYPAGCDRGPKIAGKGNMINFAGIWSELSDLNAALTNNWLIKGLVIDSDTRAVSTLNALTEPIRNYSQGTLSIDPNFNTFVERNNTVNNDFYYNIYRNENLIKTTTNLSYTEEIFNTGVYNYCVEYVKGDCISSQVCETVNIENLSCGTPTMQLTDYSDQSGYKILVSTNNIPEADLYRIYNENNELLYEMSSTFSGAIFTATPGVNHCFKMTSVCVFNGDSIESDYSNQECMVVDCYESPVAYFMKAEGKIVHINWSRNATSYAIYKNGEVYAENFSSTLGFGVGYEDLIEGETYCFQIASLCNSGDTLWSNEICYTVPQCSVTTNFTGVICSGENYLENGFSLINPTSGTYTQNLLTSLYCDSTVVLNLTVNPVYNEEIYETVCNSYTWNNQTYTESGDYIQYFQTVAGCDSTVTLHLTVNYPTTNEFSEIACDSYSWNNQVYTESGDYIQHFQTVAGCDSTVTLHLIVNYSTTNEFSVTACDSYTWNNQTYTTSDDYIQQLQTVAGCDSMVTLHLTIKNSTTYEFYETACDSYTWNNQVYTQSGNYPQQFIAANGCDSIVTLYLTVNYSSIVEFSEIACDSYSWNNQVYTESGDYIQHFQTVAGCDSTVTLHLIVNYSTTNEFSVTACDSYTWNNQVYTESGDYIQQLQTVAGCDSMVTLHLTIKNSTTYEFYETACDSYTWNNQVYTQSGNYPQQFIAANGCDSTATLHLTVNYSSIVEFSEIACDSYSWNNQVYTESGDYIQHFQTVAGCDSTVILHLIVNYSTTNEFSITACDSYTWNNQTYTISDDYIQQLQTVAGCDSMVTLHLTINNSITYEFYETVCDSYTWNNQVYTQSGNYPQQFIAANGCDSTVTLHLTVNYSTTNEFSVTACNSYSWNNQVYTESGDYIQHFQTISGCDSTATLHLTVNYSTTNEFSVTACDSYSWNNQVYTESGDYIQHFQTIAGCDSTVTLHLIVNYSTTNEFSITACDSYTWNNQVYTESGDYIQHFQTVAGCDSIVTLHLTINESPILEITGNTEIQQGESTTLTATSNSNIVEWLWSTGETTASITVSPTETSTYSVIGIDENGCESEISITVNVWSSIIENESLNYKIYPNPTDNFVQIKGKKIETILIYNSINQLVEKYFENPIEDSKITINTNHFESGMYFIFIKNSEGKTTTKKLIIAR